MRRWIIIIIIFLISILGAKTIFSTEKTGQIIMPEAKIDNILLKLNNISGELKKLDQILENQAQIKDELKIIKVRASR